MSCPFWGSQLPHTGCESLRTCHISHGLSCPLSRVHVTPAVRSRKPKGWSEKAEVKQDEGRQEGLACGGQDPGFRPALGLG